MYPQAMKRRTRIILAAGMFFAPCGANLAALTNLADLPMAYVIANQLTGSLKHNLMFMLDDSGSMAWNYTPDYVNDAMCYDYKDNDNSLGTALQNCIVGDPLYMSPDFNGQYYNPEIRYDPPYGYPAASFTAAKHDPFGVQNSNMLGQSQTAGSTVDLTASWPDRQWCDTSSGGNCVTNTQGYDYPNSVYGYGQNNGSTNYVSVAPYYWRILPSEYCTDDELRTCSSTITATQTVASKTRWCTDATLTNCQARKLPGYDFPRMVGKWTTGTLVQPPQRAVYELTFSGVNRNISFSSTSASIKLNTSGGTYTFLSGSFIGTTSNSGSGNTRAAAMADFTFSRMISSVPGFTVSYPGSGPTIYITATNTGPAYNGTFSINLPKFNVSSGSAGTLTATPTSTGSNQTNITGTYRTQQYTMKRYTIDNSEVWEPKLTTDSKRTDCAGSKCTAAEEKQNFANWYSYYRTRMQAMKSAASIAFSKLDGKLRVGFNTINESSLSATSNKFLALAPFEGTQRTTWFTKLFATAPSGSTPLRSALKRMGQMYSRGISGVDPYDPDPDLAQCQRNFTLLTTDGFWNSDSGVTFGNYDNNVNDALANRQLTGRFDGGSTTNASDTLADVAYYYYNHDLVTTIPNQVKPNLDGITYQNMTTYTLGLGVDGVMRYVKDYQNTGDFQKIKDGVAGACSWSSSCNWPVPVADSLTAVDDLWHAAVNGGGKYFSARNPSDLVSALTSIVADIDRSTGSGGAAATSSPNITQSDNWLFSSTYTPDPSNDDWSGEVQGRQLNPNTGMLDPVPGQNDWLSMTQLDQMTLTNRKTYTFLAGSRRNFEWSALSTAEQAYFSNKGSALDQYSGLSTSDKATLDFGPNMVNFIAGEQNTSRGTIFRNRQHRLGDIVHSRPAYIKAPPFGYTDTDYGAYVQHESGRAGVVYVGANDGMLHALEGTTGKELWAYVPQMLMPELYRLAERSYLTKHRFFVDGEPQISDVKLSSGWATIVVVGMGKGGRGYAALDITNPTNPKTLWEFCASPTLCDKNDPNLGYSFGNAVITKWTPATGTTKWVVIVTSGYNNAPDSSSGHTLGDGQGWLYILDAETGDILSKTSTNSGTTSAPSGLGRINVWVDNPYTDNTGKYVYAGDLNGDLWRFDLTATYNSAANHPVPVIRLATFMNSAASGGLRQPITTKPELVQCNGYPMVLQGTGQLLGSNDISNTDIQSIYGIVDRGTSYGSGTGNSSTLSARNYSLVQQVATEITSGTDKGNFNLTNNAVNPAPGFQNGWYLDLAPGQRVNVDPALGLGTLVIAGNKPTSTTACEFKGVGVTYQLAACSGGLVISNTTMVGKLDSNAMVAGLTLFQLSDGRMFVNRSRTDGAQIQEQVLTNTSAAGGKRVSWRELMQ